MSKEIEHLERCSKIFVSWKRFTVTIFSFLGLLVGGVYIYSATITAIDQKVKTDHTRLLKLEQEVDEIKQIKNTIDKIADKLEVK